jgi:MFS family permease
VVALINKQGKLMSNEIAPSNSVDTAELAPKGSFFLLCFAGYLFAIGYGVTFLLPLLVSMRGGDEAIAGNIISVAALSTVIIVILSGHIADLLGTAKSVACSGLILGIANLGFALSEGTGNSLLLLGFILGIGWGAFYTLGPILVSAIISPARRSHYFALLSGLMMAGIGTGPIIGRILTAYDFPIESAYFSAALASLLGALACFTLNQRLHSKGVKISLSAKVSWTTAQIVLRSAAIYPIIMVGLGGAIFGGISSFQTSYAIALNLDYSLYFMGFMSAVIIGRLFLSGYVVNQDPLLATLLLTSMIVISTIMFSFMKSDALFYIASAVVLGLGYGLTYSVINGQVANQAPTDLTPQALLLFSLSYFIGVFGFPFFAGHIIVSQGI